MADSKDLDFDELDKAVNSLMGGVKETDATKTSTTLDINTTLAPDEEPTYKNLDHAAQGIGDEAINRSEKTVSINEEPMLDKPEDSVQEQPEASSTPIVRTPPPVPAAKRSGRFMDVVHPSSDMKTAPVAKKVSREGVTIAASSDAVEATPAVEMTDNLPASSDSAPVDAPEPTEAVAPGTTPEPLTSPFLPDAKVEKRPLGGQNADAKPELEDPLLREEETFTEPEPQAVDVNRANKPDEKVSEPEEPEKKKDDEFSKMDAMDEPAQNLTEVVEHVPEEFKDELLAVEKSESGQEAAEVKHPQIASIPKQYQEKPSTSDTKNGSIYDTDQYHKPLAHPAQQKSGWMWVLITIILIIVGGALGAAAYFFGLI